MGPPVRAVEVATAVGTVAAGVLAVGAIGAMMAVTRPPPPPSPPPVPTDCRDGGWMGVASWPGGGGGGVGFPEGETGGRPEVIDPGARGFTQGGGRRPPTGGGAPWIPTGGGAAPLPPPHIRGVDGSLPP